MSELTFEQMLEESLKTIHTGEVVEGTVIDVKPEEIILNIGYKSDGILTRNEYTNEPNVDLTTVVKPGDTMEVKVLKVNDGEGQVLVAQRDADLCCLHVVDLLGFLEVVVQQDLDQIVAGLLVGEVTTGLAGGDGGGFQLVNIDAARGTFLILIGTGDTGDKDGIVEQVRLQNVGVALVYVLCVNENAHRLSLLSDFSCRTGCWRRSYRGLPDRCRSVALCQ